MCSPPGFQVRAVTIWPGDERSYREDEWRDALVQVRRGEVELVWRSGFTCRMTSGDVIWLAGLPLRALHNPTPDPALLIAVSRRGSADR